MWAMAAIMVTFIMGGGVGSGKTPLWLHDALAAVSIADVRARVLDADPGDERERDVDGAVPAGPRILSEAKDQLSTNAA